MVQRILLVFLFFTVTGVRAQHAKLVLPVGHTGTIMKARFSPDGRFVLTASEDGTAKLWDKASGRLLQTYAIHTQGLTDIAFNADGSLLATASEDSTVGVWETVSGKLKYHFGHHKEVTRVSFNNTSTELMSSSREKMVRLWDLTTGELIENIENTAEGYFLQDDRFVIFENYGSTTFCRREPTEVKCFQLDGWPTGVEMLDDQSAIITTSRDSTLAFLDLEGKVQKKFKLDFSIGSFSLSSDEKSIVLVSANTPFAEVRSLADTTLLGRFGDNTEGFSNRIEAQFSETGNYLFMMLEETGAFIINSVRDGSVELEMHYDRGYEHIQGMSFSPDGKTFAIAAYSDNMDLWSVNSNIPLTSFKGYAHRKQVARTVMRDSFVVVQSGRTNVEFWDNLQHKLVYTLEDKAEDVRVMRVAQDESMIATIDGNNDLQMWETRSGRLASAIPIGRIPSESVHVQPMWVVQDRVDPFVEPAFTKTIYGFEDMVISRDASMIVTTSQQTGSVPVWDVSSGKLVVNINLGSAGVTGAAFSPDDQRLIAVGREGAAVLYDFRTAKLTSLNGHDATLMCAAFHPSGSFAVTGGYDSTVKVWDTRSGKMLHDLLIGQKVTNARFSSDGDKMIVTADRYVGVFDVDSITAPHWLNPRDIDIDQIEFFNDDADLLITFDHAGPVRLNMARMAFDDLGAIGEADHVSVSSDGDAIITAGGNRITKWDAKKGTALSSFFTVGPADYLAEVPGNYYRSSPGASKLLHYVTPDLKVIGFEQLDIRYNRPDKVLEAIGSRDTTLIRSYKRAYLKRISRMGIDTTQFGEGYSVPQADFANRGEIRYDQVSARLTLKIHAFDSLYRLDKFNVWVNEVPLFGVNGLKIRRKDRHAFDTTIVITLSQGENSMETSVTNVNATESFRKPVVVKYVPTVVKPPRVHFVGIGINIFADAGHNLSWSVKDIRDLSLKFREKYPDIAIDTLFDKRVTRENIRKLKPKLKELREDDILIVAYSGHGLLSRELDYFLSTYDVDFSRPELRGVAYEELESLMDHIRPRKKLMLIDACHSGELDKEAVRRIASAENSLDSLGTRTKGAFVVEKKSLGLENSFELMQSLFLNVSRGTGATIISAAGGMQFAQERGDLKNGVFTYSIIDAFNKGESLTVSQLRQFVEESVTRLTDGLQKPTSRHQTHGFDWVIWP